jgi:hypothetical protein
MSDLSRQRGTVPVSPGADRLVWLLGLAGLLVWQGWLTLQLFGASNSLLPLTSNEPITSGRHPLHLYHGYLGARSLATRGSLSCFDPAFCAGYPKTPVFDGGSRPAELVLAASGGDYRPAVYKIALALFCLSVPWLLWFVCRSLDLSRASAFLAALIGVLLWWSPPVRETLEAGEIDRLLGSLMLLVQAALLIRYHQRPDLASVFGLLLACFLGWLASPVFQLVLLPLFLGYYLSVGPRHHLLWHSSLLGIWLTAVGINLFWLIDWVDYWWISVPDCVETCTMSLAWSSRGICPLGASLTGILLLGAGVGLVSWRRRRQKPTARIIGLGLFGMLTLALLGLCWKPLIRLATAGLLVPALFFAIPAAALGLPALCSGLRKQLGLVPVLLLGLGLPATAGYLWRGQLATWGHSLVCVQPFHIGLDEEQANLVAGLSEETTNQARILWEDRQNVRAAPHWTALLPLLTDRSFLGGLDPQSNIEHSAGGLLDQALAGRPLRDWNDAQLAEYCDRYNVGWIMAWSEAAVTRFRAWPAAESVRTFPLAGGGGQLFRIRRQHSYALVGSVQWLHADAQRIVLGDVTPDKGRVVLSLHYQSGMRVTPGRIHLEKDPNSPDAIPLVRLLLDDPAARVTITWQKR